MCLQHFIKLIQLSVWASETSYNKMGKSVHHFSDCLSFVQDCLILLIKA